MCIFRESYTYWLILTLPSSSLLRYLRVFVSKHILLRLLHDPTPVLLELPRTNTSFEDLIKLFQRARFGLRKEKVEPDDTYEV